MNTYVPYEDFAKLSADSQKLNDVKELLKTEFLDATCQVLALKAILGLIPAPAVEDPTDDPTEEPSDDPVVDPEPSEPTENEGGETNEGDDTTPTPESPEVTE